MKLFRVQMWGEEKTFTVEGSGTPPNPSQFFLVADGQFLQTIDMVVDMGGRALKYSNGPATIREPRAPEIEALMKAND